MKASNQIWPWVFGGLTSLAMNAMAEPLFDVILGRPTDHSVAISVLATNDLHLYCEYGTLPGSYSGQTPGTNLTAGIPEVLPLESLLANTQYYYRLNYQGPNSTNYESGIEHTFHTQRAATNSFTFVIEADPHYGDPNASINLDLWRVALTNMLADTPDLLIDLGDTFMTEKLDVTNYTGAADLCREVRNQLFSIMGPSVPLFLVNGNHEAELGWLLSQTQSQSNIAVWATQARQLYYPCPTPDSFYSGNTNIDPYVQTPRDDHYSFIWGNVLFVVLDPFWNTSPKPGSTTGWNWTLGTHQYAWLQQTLSQSTATFKFVFIHHLVGGSFDGAARGGVEFAPYFEWGGYNTNGIWGFATNRPGWAMPIQNLLLSNSVNAVFHGHDHLFVKQELDPNGDGIPELIYQECPQPSSTNYNSTGTALGYGYTNGILQGSSGHLRVSVTPAMATVEYVRAYLPADEGIGKSNRMVTYSYSIPATNNYPPIITNIMITSISPTNNTAWITATVTDDVGVASVLLNYKIGDAEGITNAVFLETMASNAVKNWAGTDCDNAWDVTSVGGKFFEQKSGANYGGGNTNGLEFKGGTASLTNAMISPSESINASGVSGFVEFRLLADNQGGASGWTFQLDGGTGFVTRLSGLTGTNHAWQLFHYDLQPSELVSNLALRFQFCGGLSSNRVHLDQIAVNIVGGSHWTNATMLDDGLHGDGLAGDNIYGVQIPSQSSGILMSYYLTAADGADLLAPNPPEESAYAYTALLEPNLVLGRPSADSITINALADTDLLGYVEYGTQPDILASQTMPVTLSVGEPAETEISDLQADTRYYFRLRYKNADESLYHVGQVNTFHTQRASGSTFIFSIQGDSHPEREGNLFESNLYVRTLLTAASDQPDFYLSIGDDFSVDTIPTNSINAALVTERYTLQRQYLGLIGSSAPLFLVNGNHEQSAAYLLDGTSNNIAVWAHTARNKYYPEPAPDSFYTGNTNVVPYIGLLRDYYAWTWGDALFVAIDPYWGSTNCVDNNYWTGIKRTNMWDVSHGDAQYQWLKTTLEQSPAKYKFVFAHHVLGTGRGGIEDAALYEWGGQNANGTWGFASNRPTWALPIHQLMATNHVTIFFQGHDHIFAQQQLDGVTYLTLPNPADANYSLWNSDAFTNCIFKTNNTGYARITVSPAAVTVDYVRTYLPGDEGPDQTNGMVTYRFSIPASRLDSVGDGIPDWWRAQYFGGDGRTTNDQSCATCDPDEDGYPNRSEYGAGTLPKDFNSYLAIMEPVLTPESPHPVIIWQSATGKNYRIQCSTNLLTDGFTVPVTTGVAATPLINAYTDTTANAGTCFYRIAVE